MTAVTNNLKTAVLLGALFGLLVFVGSFWGTGGMILAGIFGVIMNFGAWFFSDRIAITAMRGREATARTHGPLLELVHELADNAGLPMPRVYVCPQQAPNAFATGRSPSKAAVAVTEGALHLLDEDEMRGVMAHELAHVKNRDTLTSTIAATVAGIFSVLAQWAMFGAMFGGMGGNREGANPLAMLAMVALGAVGAGLLKAMISRSREFVADADGARIAGSPHGLVSALRKLEAHARRVPLRTANPAMNNLFIVEPFSGSQALTRLFATHPPTERRIEALLRG